VAKLRAIKAELIRRKYGPSAQVGEWLKKVVHVRIRTFCVTYNTRSTSGPNAIAVHGVGFQQVCGS